MYKPYFSFSFAILVWFILVLSFWPGKPMVNQYEIPIEAEMFGEIIEKKALPKFKKNEEVKEQKDDKISDLKKAKKPQEVKHHDHHYQKEVKKNIANNEKQILFRPLPQIPYDLRKEAFSTKAIVRFYVTKNGDVKKIEFKRAASSPKLNYLLMKELKKWKFEESNEDFVQDVNVSFVVR